jgi:flagellar basal body-associated protein FliL
MDGDSDVVPQKVELDLDGIFDMARKEAETISPDSTFQPVEAPAPAPEPEHEQEAEVIDTAPLNASAPVKKVARFKMILVVATLSLIGLGLVFVVYTLLFNKPKAPVLPLPTYEADPIDTQRVPISGEMPLERFIIPMVDRESPVTVEMALILHYRDQADESVLKAQEVQLRDISYRLAKEAGASLLTDTEARQRFQANLLATLNNIDQIKADPENPRLTYVQISLLRRR